MSASQPCTLHVGTHNVNGALGSNASSRLQSMVRLWCQLRLAIVCVQETHLTPGGAGECEIRMNEMARKLQHPGWDAWWSHRSSSSAGVGILVRRDLMRERVVKLRENRFKKRDAEVLVQGRVIRLPIKWGGHKLYIGCLYLPSGDAGGQRSIITKHLGPSADVSVQHIWGGDYNFVENVGLDRCNRRLLGGLLPLDEALVPAAHEADPITVPARASMRLMSVATAAALTEVVPAVLVVDARLPLHRAHQDTLTARVFSCACPDLQDVFRLKHPVKVSYTYVEPRWASRIDRFMTSSELGSFITACDTLQGSIVDHRPVGLKLLAKVVTQKKGKGLKRMRLHFASIPELKGIMQRWLEGKVGDSPIVWGHAGLDVSVEHDIHVLAWWRQLKVEMLHKAAVLNKQALNQRLCYTCPAVAVAQANVLKAMTKAEQERWGGGNLERAVYHRSKLANAVAVQDTAIKFECQQEWVLSKERPSTVMSRIIQHSDNDRAVAGLRCPDGYLEVQPGRVADVAARHWAATSKAVETCTAAQEAVLSPLRADPLRQIKAEVALEMGDQVVTEAEVKKALGGAKGGRSPGPDGIAYDLYKEFREVFIPVLSAVFTSIGRCGSTGEGFLDGAISILYKKGDRSMPANYRPITLLNTDYRLLAKVMAARLGKALRDVVSVEQTAFLKGRNIGENILLLQLLPQMLKQKGQSAVVAFCDFAKAYDTIDRGFLLKCMECMGAGSGFIRWVNIMLSDTRACAVVNGHVSKKYVFVAGVRQGCPLAPLLYLFIAQSLQTWLQSKGVGIELGNGKVLAAKQYADDTKALLKSLLEGDVRSFLEVMSTFQKASGQRLNETKTELLPIGALGPDTLPMTVCGLKVVSVARGVGVSFDNNEEEAVVPPVKRRRRVQPPVLTQAAIIVAQVAAGAAAHRIVNVAATRQATSTAAAAEAAASATLPDGAVDVDTVYDVEVVVNKKDALANKMSALLASILLKYGLLARMGLSIFGRATAAASYGISMMLFVAEYTGVPVGCFNAVLQQGTTRLVDRGQAPSAVARALTGVPTALLYGRPCEGGFGAIAWKEHIVARHACWAARLIAAGANPCQPCFQVAIQVVQGCHLYLSTLAFCCQHWPADMGKVPEGPLTRLYAGMCALPAIEDVSDTPLIPGDWCYSAPLWGNPLMPVALMHAEFAPARGIRGLGCIGDLVATAFYVQLARDIIVRDNMSSVWLRGDFISHWISLIVSVLPAGWLEAAVAVHKNVLLHSATRPSLAVALAVILPRLGWHMDRVGESPQTVLLTRLTVKDATALQLSHSRDERTRAHACFIHESYDDLQGGDALVLADVQQERIKWLSSLFPVCWDLAWENKHKEIFWRLSVDGVADGHRWFLKDQVCACGFLKPRRGHFFWGCPVAVAVVQAMHQAVCPNQPPLVKNNVWQMHAPAGVSQISWTVACLSGLNGMDKGRRKLLSLKLSRGPDGGDDPDFRAPRRRRVYRGVVIQSNADKLAVAKGTAVSEFLSLMAAFKALRRSFSSQTGAG